MKTSDIVPQQQARNVLFWLAELDTGNYPQGAHQLGNWEEGFCCLGVANEVLALGHPTERGLLGAYDSDGRLMNDTAFGFLSNAQDAIAYMNDYEDKTLMDIALEIRAVPHIYFVKEVADIILQESTNEKD